MMIGGLSLIVVLIAAMVLFGLGFWFNRRG
jgi:hypothetical protein